ncbi:aminoglycoside adenylyltransferase domain-containing protein [Oceanobacillus massiliensis]|uniref:aminoglycoside adenylyltransferase domain-containing protein n=1 Tax=Oceanobacillus massiliensis TaxID=1465765 RepID=UPI00028A0571|nr:aminoglycoside adenylyltransferase domain-containing protein [Oceanobacillus massiliensis]
MGYDLSACPSDVKDFIINLQKGISEIVNDRFVGFYLHGSLAMGGFNPKSSDIDVLVITNESMKVEDKRNLAQFFLNYSNSPYPIEISFLNTEQLKDWKHPCPFDFHYSDFWRKRYENDLLRGTYTFLNDEVNTDTDLAAHITITNHRGICVEGEPIDEVFPSIPKLDYISSILGDYQECLGNIEEDPIYCSLNLIRVFWYLKEGAISSKQEAGNWGLQTFPQELSITIRKVVNSYANKTGTYFFDKGELILLRNYISEKVQKLLH